MLWFACVPEVSVLKTITNLCINGKRKKGLWEVTGLDEVVRLGLL